ncbi:hypothetical protein ACJIZ3_019879 [Penstemon smallii]|uniref:Uncharacterized protein n=1 Tax=Penstemon smallii TaxID=265156 RepID=A0ABD3T2D2_9LAMI
MRIPHLLYTFIWFFLLLQFFHVLYIFNCSKTTNIYSPSPLITHRKALTSKFDFEPFLKRHRHQREHQPRQGPPISSEIDPRYGAEKRLVPSGPNPLHH